jgi:hypothetical protein
MERTELVERARKPPKVVLQSCGLIAEWFKEGV